MQPRGRRFDLGTEQSQLFAQKSYGRMVEKFLHLKEGYEDIGNIIVVLLLLF